MKTFRTVNVHTPRLQRSTLYARLQSLLTCLLVNLLLTTLWPSPANLIAQSDNNQWDDRFASPGLNGVVNALVVDGNGNLYAGGEFTMAGGTSANHIAKWNGSIWSALGSGLDNTVKALAVDSSGNLYAGGEFTTAGDVTVNRVAQWDGSAWSALGGGVDGYGAIYALATDNIGNLYIGGSFETVSGISANHVAKWNGSTWSPLSSGMNSYSSVKALAVDSSGTLYAGGNFTMAGGVFANYIAKWNGSVWSALGNVIPDAVATLAIDNSGNLYVGGGVRSQPLMKWNGSTWSMAREGGNYYALTVDNSDNLYVGGYFRTDADPTLWANYIAKWSNGSGWSTLGGEMDNYVYALAVDNSYNLFAGGYFTNAGGVPAEHAAKWNGTMWSALNSINSIYGYGLNSADHALATTSNGNLYAGGDFTTAGPVSANYMAQWNGRVWSALGSGMDGTVNALAVGSSGTLYAGGWFNSAGGISANYVAKWNGSAWGVLGNGMDNAVNALVVDSSGALYAGGWFSSAGGTSANFVAKWDGSTWSPLGTGMDGVVNALAIDSSGTLYAGGDFNTADGVPAHYVAKWNGSTWSSLGSGMDASVNTLAVDSTGNLYAGGAFSHAGGLAAKRVALWHNSSNSWSALDGDICVSTVSWRCTLYALTTDGSGNLYAGGYFGLGESVAKWDGSIWNSLGSGVLTSDGRGTVYALAVDASNALYVGGSFVQAGEKPSEDIARWAEPVNSTNQTTKIRTDVVWNPTPKPEYGIMGVYTLAFNFTNNFNNPKRSLRGVYYEVIAATKAYLIDPVTAMPGGIGTRQLVPDASLPSGDSLWQFGETLTNQQYQVGVTGSGWKLTLAIYGVDNGQRGKAEWLDTIELEDEQFPLSDHKIFLPAVQR